MEVLECTEVMCIIGVCRVNDTLPSETCPVSNLRPFYIKSLISACPTGNTEIGVVLCIMVAIYSHYVSLVLCRSNRSGFWLLGQNIGRNDLAAFCRVGCAPYDTTLYRGKSKNSFLFHTRKRNVKLVVIFVCNSKFLVATGNVSIRYKCKGCRSNGYAFRSSDSKHSFASFFVPCNNMEREGLGTCTNRHCHVTTCLGSTQFNGCLPIDGYIIVRIGLAFCNSCISCEDAANEQNGSQKRKDSFHT